MDKNTSSRILKLSKKIKSLSLLGNVCCNCKNDNIFQLTFHHKNDKEKKFTINDMIVDGKRWSSIEKEIEKCILLCENCHRELHYEINEVNDYSRRKSKNILLEFKGNKCEMCGYDKCASALVFHHKNPVEKEYNIADISIRMSSLDEITTSLYEELNKCELLCANCHQLKHTDINFFEENKEKIYEKIKNHKELRSALPREEVLIMYDSGIKQIDIAKHFKASKGTICDILKKYYNNKNGDSM